MISKRNIAARFILFCILVVVVCFYPLLYTKLTGEGLGQRNVFYVAYVFLLAALIGMIFTPQIWIETLRGLARKHYLLLITIAVLSLPAVLIWCTIFRRWGVISVMLLSSLVVNYMNLLNSNNRRIVVKRVVFTITLSMFFFYLIIGVGETYFRIHPEQVGGGGGGNPALREYYHGLYSINSLGLKDHEFTLTPATGVFRILMLGDSFTYGQGVCNEDTFPDKLEHLLNKQAGSKTYETINAGQPGWNTVNEVEFLHLTGWKYNPDLVILQFYCNDIEVTEKSVADKKSKSLSEILFGTFLKYSYFVFYLNHSMQTFQYSIVKEVDKEAPRDYFWALLRNIETNSLAWTQCREAFTNYSAECRKHGVTGMVVLYPDMGDHHEAVSAIHKEIKRLCNELKLPVLDLLAQVECIPIEQRPVLPFDHHPSAKVHELAASCVLKFLQENNLIP